MAVLSYLLKNHLFFYLGCTVLHPHQQCMSSIFSTFSPTGCFALLLITVAVGVKCGPDCAASHDVFNGLKPEERLPGFNWKSNLVLLPCLPLGHLIPSIAVGTGCPRISLHMPRSLIFWIVAKATAGHFLLSQPLLAPGAWSN